MHLSLSFCLRLSLFLFASVALTYLPVGAASPIGRMPVSPPSPQSDTNLQPLWFWGALGDGLSGQLLEIVDVDGDEARELVTTGEGTSSRTQSAVFVRRLNTEEMLCIWDADQRIIASRIAQADGDSAKELLLATAERVVVLDLASCRVELSGQLGLSASSAALGDFVVGGAWEVAYSNDGDLYIASLDDLLNVTSRRGFGGTTMLASPIDLVPGDDLVVLGSTALVLNGSSLDTIWEFTVSPGFQVAAGNLIPGGLQELVFDDYSEGIRAYELGQGNELFQYDSRRYARAIRLQDIDGDTVDEIVVNEDRSWELVVLDASGEVLYSVPASSRDALAALVDDTDGDGALEMIWTRESGILARADLLSGEFIEQSTRIEGPFFLGDLSDQLSGGLTELVVGFNGSVFRPFGGGVARLNAQTGRELLRLDAAETFGQVYAAASANVDEDPVSEICYSGGYRPSFVTCVDGATGEVQWERELPDEPASQIEILDVDNDFELELVAVLNDRFIMSLNAATGWLEWQTETLSISPTVGYNGLQQVGGELWLASGFNGLKRIDGETGNINSQPDTAEISAIVSDGQIVYGAFDRVGVGVLSDDQQSLEPLLYASGRRITNLVLSDDGSVLLAGSGNRPSLESTLIPISTEGQARELGTVLRWDERLPNRNKMIITTGLGVMAYELPDLRVLFGNGFE